MSVINITAQPGQVLHLGRVGEGNQVNIKFNLDSWASELANGGTVTITYMLGGPVPKYVNSYDVTTQIYHEGETPQYYLIWEITSDLTTIASSGVVQISYADGNGTTLSTYLYQTVVTHSVLDIDTVTTEEQSTYNTWLIALQNAYSSLSTIQASAETLPYYEQATATITQTMGQPTQLEFGIPGSKPFIIDESYNSINNLVGDLNNSNLEQYAFVTISSSGDDYDGWLYLKLSDNSTSYTCTNITSHIINELLEEPITNRAYMLGESYDGTDFSIRDVIVYDGEEWSVVLKYISDISGAQGTQGIGLNSVIIAKGQDNKYRLYYTTYNPATGTTSSPILVTDSNGFFNYLDSTMTSVAENAQTATTKAEEASRSAANANTNANLSRQYAEGKKLDNTDVTSNEAGYQNNSKYWAKKSEEFKDSASISAVNAQEASEHCPQINTNTGMWQLYSTVEGDYVDTTTPARGPKGDTGAAINILGHEDTLADIPSATYTNGDGYFIGTSSPYDLYIYYNNTWNNSGPISGVTLQLNENIHAIQLSI